MTASSSIISLANRALLSIGARAQIQSLQEGSTESNAINALYSSTFQQLARSAMWNCLRAQKILSLLAAAAGTPENPQGTTMPLPPFPYLYQYAAPSDSLDIRFLLPTFPTQAAQGGNPIPLTTSDWQSNYMFGSPGQIPFEVAYAADAQNNPLQVILTNLRDAQAVYTVNQQNPVIFDSLFEAAMVASLAVYLVPALSLNLPLMQMSIKTAEAMIGQARVRDGDEGYTSQNREADWMRARNQGGNIGWNQRGFSPMYGSGLGMSWPGGWE